MPTADSLVNDPDSLVDRARDIMSRIRRQVFRPDGTTAGSCANGCGEYARGSGTCADCLGNQLDDLIDSSAGTNYVYACVVQKDAERAVLEAAGGDDERG